jgi:hypothetical protein
MAFFFFGRTFFLCCGIFFDGRGGVGTDAVFEGCTGASFEEGSGAGFEGVSGAGFEGGNGVGFEGGAGIGAFTETNLCPQ